MHEELWDKFVIYVNAYYAVQEAYDSARRAWERPADGLDAFCRDANPFLWDEQGSAEAELYEGFSREFDALFGNKGCTASEGRAFARNWLLAQEGGIYGTSLASALDEVSDEFAWEEACEPVQRQIAARAMRLERTPQDMPEPYVEPDSAPPSKASIEAVIALLAQGDEDFADGLRARLARANASGAR